MGEVRKPRPEWSAVQGGVRAALEAAAQIPGEAGVSVRAALRGASEAVYACEMWDTLRPQVGEHWCNSYAYDGETVSRPCTCSIGKHHEADGSTYDLGEVEHAQEREGDPHE